jgi:hypothetical protein
VFLAKNNSTLQEDFHKLFLLMLFWTSVIKNLGLMRAASLCAISHASWQTVGIKK